MSIASALIGGPLGFGTAPLGNMFRNISEEEASATVAAAWQLGTRFFDTAPFYGAGLAEIRLGKELIKHKRDEYVLSTKVGRLILDEIVKGPQAFGEKGSLFEHGRKNKVIYDYSSDGAKRSIEDSLKRMGVDRRTLLAGRYTLLDHERALQRLMPMAVEKGVQIVVGGPYSSGVLAGGRHFEYAEASPQILAKVAKIKALAQRHGVPIKAAALQFSLAHPAAVAVIPGASKPERIKEDHAALKAKIPNDFWRELRAEGLVAPDAPLPTDNNVLTPS
jgi:D-threo-aldose 1-dehydrogenase